MVTFEEAVVSLLKSGAIREKDLIVKNVTVTDCGNWTRIALTLNREVDGAVSDKEGNWSIGKTRIIFMSLYSIVGLFKNDGDTMAIANYITNHATALQVILTNAKIEILQQKVKAHGSYINVFTDMETEHDSDHDSIFNYLIGIEFSDKAIKAIEKIEDKLLGL